MKLYTSERTELMEVKSLEPAAEGLVIHGHIMGTMPLSALLTPAELRRAFWLVRPRAVWKLLWMLFQR